MPGQSLIGNLAVNLMMETAAFEKGASYAEKRVNKLARNFEKIGQGWVDLGQKMSVGVTLPLVAFGATAIKAAAESRDAVGQVETALKSMGGAAGRSSEQLQALAGNLMANSLYDDDEILRKVTANLLTFGNVSGAVFDQAQQAIVDMAARMGTDLQSATIMVGKALNDPIKGLGALRKVGIQFTEQQQDQIKTMAAAGNMAGAQTIMLKELERQFGNSAKAARANDPMGALKQSFNDFQEKVGDQLLKVLPTVADAITRMLNAFTALPEPVQEGVIIVAALAAAFGPLLTILGTAVSAMAPFLGAMSAVFAEGGVLVAAKAALIGLGTAFGPVLLVVAALAAAGYLIYQNWDKIAPVLEELWGYLQKTLGPPLQELISTVKKALTDLWNGPFGTLLRKASDIFQEFGGIVLRVFGAALVGAIKGFADLIAGTFKNIASAIRFIVSVFDGTLAMGIGQSVSKMVGAVRLWMIDKLNAIWDTVKSKVDAVKGWFFGLYDAVVGHSYIPDMVDGIAANMKRLDAEMVKPVQSATKKAKAAFEKLAEDVKALMAEAFPEAGAKNELLAKNATYEQAIAQGGVAGYTTDQLRGGQLRLLAPDLESNLADVWSGIGEGLDGFVDKFTHASGKTKDTAGEVKRTFKDMADDVLGSLQNLGNSIKSGGFLDIFGGVVDLLLKLGSVGVFGKGIQTNLNASKNFGGPRAMGGPVVPGKSYLVGEQGPEWFTPGSSGGKINPINDNAGGSVVRIVPSPYFDAVVDGRASKVAAPMAMASGHYARGAAQGDLARKARRRIPG